MKGKIKSVYHINNTFYYAVKHHKGVLKMSNTVMINNDIIEWDEEKDKFLQEDNGITW